MNKSILLLKLTITAFGLILIFGIVDYNSVWHYTFTALVIFYIMSDLIISFLKRDKNQQTR
ncbi:hypothetical protein [Radiobacillus sp. PE A8.2]|uniref:hypothetical protein n=1 Tax=Radiobacillus sp. PE A8.2 TaxID=3380349 RepID=UPI00388F2CE3